MMRKTILIGLFLIVIFLRSSYAETIVQANITMTLTEELNIKEADLIESAKVIYPFGDNVAEIFTKGNCDAKKSNDALVIDFNEIANGINNCKVLIKAESYFKAPIPHNSLWDTKKALMETDHITIEKEISVLGNVILDRCKEDFWCSVKEAIKEVHAFMRYDPTKGDKNYDVKYILQERKGVCAEYVTLFIALMRYLHIPAIYVSSYAYNGESYEPHAFAYVFNKQDSMWYPVDVLWKQIGYVDASHVFIGWSYDNQVKSELKIKALSGSDVASWSKETMHVDAYAFKKSNLFQAKVLNVYHPSQDEYTFTIGLEGTVTGCGEVSVVPCSYKSLSKKTDLMCVNEIKNFTFTIPLDHQESFIFTCPFNIYDTEHDSYYYNITISQQPQEEALSWFTKFISAILNLFKLLGF